MLKAKRAEGESWRECVRRYGEAQGLADECLEAFDDYVYARQATGAEVASAEGDAAFHALYEWDCLDYVDG